jgi:hypothetical protein
MQRATQSGGDVFDIRGRKPGAIGVRDEEFRIVGATRRSGGPVKTTTIRGRRRNVRAGLRINDADDDRGFDIALGR